MRDSTQRAKCAKSVVMLQANVDSYTNELKDE